MAGEHKPVTDAAFWRERVLRFYAEGKQLHQCIYDNSLEVWQYLQGETGGILRRHVEPGCRLLDAGCGYGALLDALQMGGYGRTDRRPAGNPPHCADVDYTGVDSAPILLEMARYRYPSRRFVEADLSALPFTANSFDWVVARSVRDMLIENGKADLWHAAAKELFRVGRRVLILEYPDRKGDPVPHEVVE